MKITTQFTLLASLVLALAGCQSDEFSCTVKGTVQGVKDGAKLVLQDEWNKFKVISSTTVENGTFEFHPRISVPTHVFLYAEDYKDVYANPNDWGQLKDFLTVPLLHGTPTTSLMACISSICMLMELSTKPLRLYIRNNISEHEYIHCR